MLLPLAPQASDSNRLLLMLMPVCVLVEQGGWLSKVAVGAAACFADCVCFIIAQDCLSICPWVAPCARAWVLPCHSF